jgi:hypothetical protein
MVKRNVEPDTILKKYWGSLIILIILQEMETHSKKKMGIIYH